MEWWPAYHFCVESIQKNKPCSKLLAYKSMIAAVLLGESKYIFNFDWFTPAASPIGVSG